MKRKKKGMAFLKDHRLLHAKNIVIWPHKDREEAEKFCLFLLLPLTFWGGGVRYLERRGKWILKDDVFH